MARAGSFWRCASPHCQGSQNAAFGRSLTTEISPKGPLASAAICRRKSNGEIWRSSLREATFVDTNRYANYTWSDQPTLANRGVATHICERQTLSEGNLVVTKKEIVKTISDEIGLTQLKTKEIVQKTFDAIVETLVEDHRIELRNFGVFEVKRRAARKARNPRTGEKVFVPEKFVVTFKPGKEMEERVREMEDRANEAARRKAMEEDNHAPPMSTPPPPGALHATSHDRPTINSPTAYEAGHG
jgi:nucleoid DNA-binding protein